jgi:hypothetical protein
MPNDDAANKGLENELEHLQDVQEYLKANGEASARSRSLIVSLIVASVLTGVGVLNSLQGSWMNARLALMRRSDSAYLIKYVGERPTQIDYVQRWHARLLQDQGKYDTYLRMLQTADTRKGLDASTDSRVVPPSIALWYATAPDPIWYARQAEDEYLRDIKLYDARYQAFLNSASRALVDTRFFVHVPFFGTTFDVNDLGLLAGVGLSSILLLLWFASGTEIENLRLSFKEAQKMRRLAEFYHLTAMRQVLTIPRLPDRMIKSFEVALAKPVYFVPAAVYFWLYGHDLTTAWVGKELSEAKIAIFILIESCFMVVILALAISCFTRSRKIDAIWREWWPHYLAEQFARTGDADWLKRLVDIVNQRGLSAKQLIEIIPKKGSRGEIYGYRPAEDIHVYYSEKDGMRMVVKVHGNAVVLEAGGKEKVPNEPSR